MRIRSAAPLRHFRLSCLLAAALMTIGACRAETRLSDRVAILPESAMPGLVDGFSVPRIEGIEGYWRPSDEEVTTTHEKIAVRVHLTAMRGARPVSEYYAQYAGIIVNGERLILGSFIHEWTMGSPPTPHWRETAVHGDPQAAGLSWGIVYHPGADRLDDPIAPPRQRLRSVTYLE